MRALALVALLAACGPNPYEARIDGVLLPDAEGVVPAGDAPLIKITPEAPTPAIPDGPEVRVAIARAVPWSTVKQTIDALAAKGVRPVFLVGQRREVHGFVLSDEIGGPGIRLTASADGKFCVGPPDVDEAKCVQSADKRHVNRAFVRETIREAVDAYGLTEVDAVVQPDVQWADVVRTVDGARTCCKGRVVKVKLQGS